MIRNSTLLCGLLVVATGTAAEARPPLLFESHAAIDLTMPINFEALCRSSETQDCDYAPTVLAYRDAEGNEQSLQVSIRRRDGWRAQKTNCQVPTLFVRFSPDEARGTPFEGQPELALTSHCGKGFSSGTGPSRSLPDSFESYVVNEYLGYRLYNLVTDISLRVRLARIRYVDPDNPRHDFTRYAFFSEHFDSLAERLGADLLPAKGFEPARLDLRAADEMALFHFMIGNTDWSIADQENVAMLQFPDGRHVPVLYDLDLSGLVNAHYASPAEGLPISSVRQRYFMGFCHPMTDWNALFEKFVGLREEAISIIVETPGFGRGERRMSGAYLDAFFSILGSEQARESRIVNACQPWSLM